MLPLSRASGGQPAGPGGLLARVCASMPLPASREAYPFPGRAFSRIGPLADFACFPMADGLSAPAHRTLRRAGKPATVRRGRHAARPRPGRRRIPPGADLSYPMVDDPVSVLHRIPDRMSPAGQAGMARGALEKADFQVESKKALPFAPAWDMDFRLCAGSGGMGPLTPHETNLRSYRC